MKNKLGSEFFALTSFKNYCAASATLNNLEQVFKTSLRGENLGVRREAERHAAFGRTKSFRMKIDARAGESGVAAAALPPQSKTPFGFIRVHCVKSYFVGPNEAKTK